MTTQVPQNLTSQSIHSPHSEQLNEEKLLNQIMRASSLQQGGKFAEAIEIYQQVLVADPEGKLGAVARKSLQTLNVTFEEPTASPVSEPEPAVAEPAAKFSGTQTFAPVQWFYDLPIWNKQLLGLFTSELISLGGLVGVGAALLVSGLHVQLLNQSKSELSVMDLNYNIGLDQVASSFEGEAEDVAIITAARTGVASPDAYDILRTLTKTMNIEYATLVDRNGRIIANANNNRRGEVFNPNHLVNVVLNNPARQLRATELVPWAELQKENPPLPMGFRRQDALIRYTMTPVLDPNNDKLLGVFISGDIVNQKLPIVQHTLEAFKGGYSAIYLRQPTGELVLATALKEYTEGFQSHVPLANHQLLEAAVQASGKVVVSREPLGDKVYAFAARAILSSSSKQPVAVLVRGTSETALNRLLTRSLLVQLLVSASVLAIDVLLAVLLSRAIARPIMRLRQSAQELAQGDRNVRAEVVSEDEVGQLAITFNQMARNIAASTQEVEELANLREAEAAFQRQENERLQQRVTELLLEIEGAREGNLTIRANVTADEMGSIADAFNSTVNSLRELVLQVQTVAQQVNQSAVEGNTSVNKLSIAALEQSQAVSSALKSVEHMVRSIESVASSASEAARIARHASEAASKGGRAMEYTVESIEELRNSVAETSKKVKRLTESSQEISKIVGLISEISAKTNLLAFNASIEAVRAGEHGQGFRIVADEVRRLAEQVTESTKDIEQLVTGIQLETGEVLAMMEKGTEQVVTGTRLVADTRETLSGLVEISQKIDQLVQTISVSTASQTIASQQVSQTIKEVAQVAEDTSTESQAVSAKLNQLVSVAEELQSSVAKFRVTTDD
jgi:twitching motility protein PilJ